MKDNEKRNGPRFRIILKDGFFFTVLCGLFLVLFGFSLLGGASGQTLPLILRDPSVFFLIVEYAKDNILSDWKVIVSLFEMMAGLFLIFVAILSKMSTFSIR